MIIDYLRLFPGLSTPPASSEDHRVNGEIRGDDDRAEDSLSKGAEVFRVDDREKVPGDEVSLVRDAAAAPKPVLQRSEGADPPHELDHGAPGRGREMQPGDARPAKNEKAPCDHEGDEEEMCDDDRVREELVQAGS